MSPKNRKSNHECMIAIFQVIRFNCYGSECSPSGPTAFWSLRDHVSNDNALVVAQHADVSLRNELGMTLLHAAVAKRRLDGKHDVIATLLSRGVDVSARDFEGSTARDYVMIHRVTIQF